MKKKHVGDILAYTALNISRTKLFSIKEYWAKQAALSNREVESTNDIIDYLFDNADKNGFVIGSMESIANSCNVSKDFVGKYFRKFERADLIERSYGLTRIKNLNEYLSTTSDWGLSQEEAD